MIIVTHADGRLAHTPVVPFVELYMPDHHHGSTDVKVKELATGLYHADEMNFFMPGEWEIRVQIRHEENVVEQLVWTYTL